MKFMCPKSYPKMHLHRYKLLQKAMNDLYPIGISVWNMSTYNLETGHSEINIAALAKWSLTAKLTPTERFIIAAIIFYGSSSIVPWTMIVREGKLI